MPSDGDALRHALAGGHGKPPRVLVVAAHPDDETVGCGSRLPSWTDVVIVHLTDGSPRDMADATRLGFADRASYAAERRRELERAMALAEVGGAQLVALNAVDKEAVHELARLAREVRSLVALTTPEIVLTHAYEGGHPDHDAAAAAVQLALARPFGARRGPLRAEFACYRRGAQGGFDYTFAPGPPETTVPLDGVARDRKERMLLCFATQRDVLAGFPRDVERFRPAPVYDFTRAPHEGPLLYEEWGWSIDGRAWRTLAAAALAGASCA